MADEKFYVVTQGEYSDYRILAVTTNYELAEKIAARFTDRWEKAKIETYENAEVMLRPVWLIGFDKAGNVSFTNECSSVWAYRQVGACHKNHIWANPYDIGAHVSADSLEAAIKIAAEKRAQYLAEQLGL